MKKIEKSDKILYSSLGIFIIISLLCGLFKLNSYTFFFLSVAANIFLIIIFKLVKRVLNINFNKKQKIIMLISIFLIYLFYFISILNRKFIYYWDFSCYYNLQTTLEDSFNISLFDGIKSFIGSTWSGEYGNFLSFFPEFIFKITNKTINSYVLSCVLIFIPYIIVSISILLNKLIDVFKIKKKNRFFLLSMLAFILFPILHATFIYGQPDIFGLAFIFLIIALTMDYDFEKVEPLRLSILLIITFMLLITRRWYMYFILSYYLCYGISIILLNIKNKDKLFKIIKNCILYVIIAAVFFGITLFPLFKNVIASNFANSYSYYMMGGFKAEILSQISHIGYVLFIIMLIGIIYGIIKKEYRLYTIIFIFEYFITMFLFTKVQNMGLHHSLLFVPAYMYFIYMFILLIIDKRFLCVIIVFVFALNFTFGFVNTSSKVFTDVNLKTPTQEDYDEIRKVSDWLKKNLSEENRAYMIAHNNTYNPDKFRNFYLPDKTIMNYLPYGSAILGVHPFPTELFDSKYIITTTPFEGVSIEAKYNDVFNKLVSMEKFKLIKTFDMKNGYSVVIYERVKDVDYVETTMYLDEIKEDTKDYSNLYIEVIDKYINENGLKR